MTSRAGAVSAGALILLSPVSPAADVVVLVPVLGRPHRVGPLLESLSASLTPSGPNVRPLFLVSQNDRASGIEIRRHKADHLICRWLPDRADYALKVNYGYRQTKEEFLFVAADDLAFHPGWADAALAVFAARDLGVVGTNDLSRRARHQHSTHSLVCRGYVEQWGGTCDASGDIYCELYDHQFVDDELLATARGRGCYGFAADSIVEHLHPHWGKGEQDATYAKALRATAADQKLFRLRSRKWNGTAPAGPRALQFR